MTQHSKSRQQAEIAFARTQSQSPAKQRASEEADAIARAHDEKTLRLRTARLAKELDDRKRVSAALLAKRNVPV